MDPEFEEDLRDPDYVNAFIKDWNESRLDMFALSAPNEKLIFSGVMRFFFQDRGQKAVTKCVRVTNEQTVADLMNTLIEKFCPDMKMLSTPNYELYEIHGTGDVRKLGHFEKPLIVQLLWHKDDREGRFVLKSADLKIQPAKWFELNHDEGQLKRRLSRREKKDLKKKRKEMMARNKSDEKALADHVYRELPESSLTRTISNPEAVMRRRRQQKLEKRMKEFQNKEGPQTGGILKIFAESLKPEIPYKTILASVKDNADVVTKAALEKFLLPKEEPENYCIVMAIIPPGNPSDAGNIGKERVIRSADCPLAIQNSWPRLKGVLTFHLRRRAPGTELPKKEPKRQERNKSTSSTNSKRQELQNQTSTDVPYSVNDNIDRDTMPFFLELTPEGKEINYKPKIYYINPNETVIGSSRNPSPQVQYLQLFSPKILASHCSIVNAEGHVSIVPHGPEADVRVFGKRIHDNTILRTGNVVQFGGLHTFRFVNPADMDNISTTSEHVQDSPRNLEQFEYPPYRPPLGMSSPPISPELKELILNEQVGSLIDDDQVFETTFGVDGEVETNKTVKQMYSAKSADNLMNAEHSSLRDSFRKHQQSAPDLLNMQDYVDEENLLPASLAFLDHGKDAFFAAVISEVNGAAVNFKLAPTYTLYLAARHVLSVNYRPGLTSADRSRLLAGITKRIASSVQQTIQENDYLAGGLAFWMANASELLHFYRQDIDLSPVTQSAQAILAQAIQESFALLVNAMEEELFLALPAFLDLSDEVDIYPQELDAILNDDLLERAESMELLNWASEPDDRSFRVSDDGGKFSHDQWITPAARIRHHGMPKMADVLYILSSAMSLLRRCRVNAALTIQLFSQLFHFINMWTFNRIVEPELQLCTRYWGHCLRMRLSYIEAWAERQGLELAADCHLARVAQAAHLLEATKDTAEDIAEISSTCFKLNSLQLRVLLENYLPEMDEPVIPQELIDTIVAVAESTADELTHNDGRDVKLEEDIQLQLPFLLPEEGYSSDIIRGVPPGLQEFLEPLCATGLCDLSLNPQSAGTWTAYQEPYDMEDLSDDNRDSQVVEELPIQRVTIDKGKGGLGLSICAAKGAQSDFTGIYIKAVIKGGLAHQDGRLEGGDQILSVNESGLIDVTQMQAAKIMGKSGPVITLEIIKGAAFFHGLSSLVEVEGKDKEKGNTKENVKGEDRTDSQEHQRDRNLDNVTHRRHKSADDNEHRRRRSSDDHRRQKSADTAAYSKHVLEHERCERNDNVRYQREKSNGSEKHTREQHNVVDLETDLDVAAAVEKQTHDKYHESDYDSDGNLLTTEDKEKRARQRQREIEYEQRLAKWEEERKRKEEEEELQKQKDEERRREEEEEGRYEEEVKRTKVGKEVRQEAEQIRAETERKKQEIEQKKHEAERKRLENERLRQEEEEKAYEEEQRRRHEAEEAERAYRAEQRRKQEEEEKRAYLEEQRRRQEEEERRLLREEEEDRAYEEEQRWRKEEERRRRQEEEEDRAYLEEQKQIREKENARRKQEEECHKKLKEEENKRKEQDKRQREERRRKQKEEERIRTERYMAKQQQRKEEEDIMMKEEQRREEEQRNEMVKKAEEHRKKDEEKIKAHKQEEEQRRQRENDEQVERKKQEQEREAKKKRQKEAEQESAYYARSQLDEDMTNIDDALREAERIAAEMDLFMMEEEQKIEEDSLQKRKKEERQWESEVKEIGKDLPIKEKIDFSYKAEIKPMKRYASMETNLDNIDALDALPPPPEEMFSDEEQANKKYETNIDSSSDDEGPIVSPPNSNLRNRVTVDTKKEQQRCIQEQKEKRKRNREEQERLRKDEDEQNKRIEELDRKRQQEIRQMEQYRLLKEQQEQKDREAAERRREQVQPPVRPTNVKASHFKLEHDYNHRNNTNSLSVPPRPAGDSSDEDDAPPRPPPPRRQSGPVSPTLSRGSRHSSYSGTNGYQNYQRTSSRTYTPERSVSSGFVKVTPEPATVNQGVGEPEVLDFKSKMKLFGKFQS